MISRATKQAKKFSLLFAILFLFGASTGIVRAGVINANFPDLMFCHDTGYGTSTLILAEVPFTSGNYVYVSTANQDNTITFSSVGAYVSASAFWSSPNCTGMSTTTLGSKGFMFNFSSTTSSSSSTTSTTTSTTTVSIVNNPNQDVFNGIMVFLISLFGILWVFRKPR